MRFDAMTHLIEMMRVRGVRVHTCTLPQKAAVCFDDGLREQLYGGYDYARLMQLLDKNCHPNTIYITTDQFELNYIIFKASTELIVIVGPYTTRLRIDVFESVCSRIHFPLARQSEIERFYYGVPVVEQVDILESEIIVLAKYVLQTEVFDVEQTDLLLLNIDDSYEIKDYKDDKLPMTMLEERYQNEDNLLEAVERGDLKQATLYIGFFSKFYVEKRHDDSMRNTKNYLLVLNTLLRKAVQQAAVHPAHIHDVSTGFAMKVECARTVGEIDKIVPEMIRKYCILVNNHSLRGYSPPVRKAVNYIDFNFTEQLTLEKIAEVAGVNFSYLSSQYKKETGVSVIDYINQKRLRKAQTLLLTSKLSVGLIAEKCGFADDTYFTKMFKKQYGKSPREYRKEMNQQ